MTRRHCAVKRLEASRASRDRTLDTLAHFAPSAINEHRVRCGRRSVRIQRSKELDSWAIQATACLPPRRVGCVVQHDFAASRSAAASTAPAASRPVTRSRRTLALGTPFADCGDAVRCATIASATGSG
jgi:hypothetical protein